MSARRFYRYKIDPREKRERRVQIAHCGVHRECPTIVALTLGRWAYCWRAKTR